MNQALGVALVPIHILYLTRYSLVTINYKLHVSVQQDVSALSITLRL